MSNATILLLALLIDAAVGDPEWLYSAIAHPTVLAGRVVDWLDQGLNNRADSPAWQRFWGIVAMVFLVGCGLTIGWVVTALLSLLPLGWIVVALLMSMLIAQNSLYRHVGAVASGLDQGGLAGGRDAVQHVAGRDPESLNEAGVARAALESLAENFSDAVAAPAFWALLLGLPGILAYKAVNTADSMIGYRTERHEHFGWAAARLDDLLNLVPARLAGAVLCGAAFLLSREQGRAAGQAMWRDARKHHSPNAGWPEAAMAGALGLALGGPRVYDGELVDDAWLGDGGRTDATSADIRRGLKLYVIACALQAAVVAVVAILVLIL
ncbi:MAG TPA: adenosylcobinamide-phosphate synthase CbiB [Candidatus Acidoferrum sp.]|nr:adenosylcobinamide-phosphate synthase CbiB [Candidatus Acidoferrum sp.]